MNKESIKSVLLTILVGISLFFTWNLWNSQPPFEELQNNSFVESVPINNIERELYEVIKPNKLFLHTPEQHFGTYDKQDVNNLWSEMQKWDYSLSTNRNLIQTFSKDKFINWINGNDEAKIELRFLDGVPFETFETMFNWETELIEDIRFDRIYLNVPREKEVQRVYFVSSDTLQYVEASVNLTDANTIVAEIYNQRNELIPFFAYGEDDNVQIYLPENEVKIDSYEYGTDEIEGSAFKNALFGNPQNVKQDVNSLRNRYTDSWRELNIHSSEHRVEFVNPTLRDTSFLESSALISQSVDYLNDHGGWTDDYIFYMINELNQEITYIMSIHSIPVFESDDKYFGPTKISQQWGQSEISIYERPSYQLMKNLSSNNTERLPSGHELIDVLSKDSSINIKDIKDIYIMYELQGETDQRIVKITPYWWAELQDGRVLKIDGNQRGDRSGLE
ncbi:hypothetical protein CJ195_19135 [Bacillus sp. UMB0899]|uniref:YycH family regulatory protein n=1 Tax=Metabacillus schmidteae TaxID=2730405 RepID=UPI000C807002|nr:two-component system activity regulator YycH [Metabacillus schmidteae]PMC35522.1 hypothetical protein CJ195_19135 [Bacillus sp. UMB0899]